MRIDCLDHGFVRLVSYMQPAERGEACSRRRGPPVHEDDHFVDIESSWTGDLEIVRNARVSYNADWRSGDDEGKDAKLIHRLWNEKHSTPFEAMVFTFEVQAPIFVFRQWHRHRTQSYNEISARYAQLPELFYMPKREHVGVQAQKNKQGRDDMENIFADTFLARLQKHCTAAFEEYRLALSGMVPRELARMVLPFNTYSRMFTTLNLGNLFKFLELRLDSHAQYEIRVYAEAMLKLIEPIVPVAVDAFQKSIKKGD